MKWVIFIIGLGLFCICCSVPYAYQADYALIKPPVSRDIVQKDFPGVQNSDSLMNEMSKNLIYHDSLLNMKFSVNPDYSQIGFVLTNKTDKLMKINWEEIIFIGLKKEVHRVIHTGVRLIKKDEVQLPSIIPPSTKLDDAITPVDFIRWGQPGQWRTNPLFSGYRKEELENKEIGIYFPFEIGGEKKEYTFTFKISNVKEPVNPTNY